MSNEPRSNLVWVDRTRTEKEFESPAWHLEVLQERELRLQAGKETPIDWETAKKALRDLATGV